MNKYERKLRADLEELKRQEKQIEQERKALTPLSPEWKKARAEEDRIGIRQRELRDTMTQIRTGHRVDRKWFRQTGQVRAGKESSLAGLLLQLFGLSALKAVLPWVLSLAVIALILLGYNGSSALSGIDIRRQERLERHVRAALGRLDPEAQIVALQLYHAHGKKAPINPGIRYKVTHMNVQLHLPDEQEQHYWVVPVRPSVGWLPRRWTQGRAFEVPSARISALQSGVPAEGFVLEGIAANVDKGIEWLRSRNRKASGLEGYTRECDGGEEFAIYSIINRRINLDILFLSSVRSTSHTYHFTAGQPGEVVEVPDPRFGRVQRW